MTKVYVIADLHLGHKKLAQVRGFSSVEEHDQKLVDNWNSVVTKKDVVYVLGDVFRVERLSDMRGIKKLTLGNHDQYPPERYLKYFTKIASYYEYDNCLLSHIPIHPCQFPRYRKNVHGHMHTHDIDDPFYVCVSAEQIDLTPVLLNSVI